MIGLGDRKDYGINYEKDYGKARNVSQICLPRTPISVPIVNVGKNVGKNVGQSKQAIRYIKIMNTLLTNRRTPLHEIAKMLSVSERTINRDLNVIRLTYRVEWIGASKTGRWEIEKLK